MNLKSTINKTIWIYLENIWVSLYFIINIQRFQGFQRNSIMNIENMLKRVDSN